MVILHVYLEILSKLDPVYFKDNPWGPLPPQPTGTSGTHPQTLALTDTHRHTPKYSDARAHTHTRSKHTASHVIGPFPDSLLLRPAGLPASQYFC